MSMGFWNLVVVPTEELSEAVVEIPGKLCPKLFPRDECIFFRNMEAFTRIGQR